MKKVDLSKFKSDVYISGGQNVVKKMLWFFTSALLFQSPLFPLAKIKVLILRFFGAKIGKNVNIKPNVYIKYPWRLHIGDNVWIGEKVWIANEGVLTIGNNVCISHEVLIMSGGHNYKKEFFDVYANPIVIEDGVWLGAQSAVGGGITLKTHAVLAMKSVANQDLEPYKIYRGNPAIAIKDRVIE